MPSRFRTFLFSLISMISLFASLSLCPPVTFSTSSSCRSAPKPLAAAQGPYFSPRTRPISRYNFSSFNFPLSRWLGAPHLNCSKLPTSFSLPSFSINAAAIAYGEWLSNRLHSDAPSHSVPMGSLFSMPSLLGSFAILPFAMTKLLCLMPPFIFFFSFFAAVDIVPRCLLLLQLCCLVGAGEK